MCWIFSSLFELSALGLPTAASNSHVWQSAYLSSRDRLVEARRYARPPVTMRDVADMDPHVYPWQCIKCCKMLTGVADLSIWCWSTRDVAHMAQQYMLRRPTAMQSHPSTACVALVRSVEGLMVWCSSTSNILLPLSLPAKPCWLC